MLCPFKEMFNIYFFFFLKIEVCPNMKRIVQKSTIECDLCWKVGQLYIFWFFLLKMGPVQTWKNSPKIYNRVWFMLESWSITEQKFADFYRWQSRSSWKSKRCKENKKWPNWKFEMSVKIPNINGWIVLLFFTCSYFK